MREVLKMKELIIKTILEGLELGALLVLVCAVGIRKGAVGMVHLYSVKVQERCVNKGLTTHKKIKKNSLLFKANSRFFENEDEVPKRAITMGMVSIMRGKKILLIANGKAKRDILEKAFYGPITPEIPASILQLHPDITVIYSEN